MASLVLGAPGSRRWLGRGPASAAALRLPRLGCCAAGETPQLLAPRDAHPAGGRGRAGAWGPDVCSLPGLARGQALGQQAPQMQRGWGGGRRLGGPQSRPK